MKIKDVLNGQLRLAKMALLLVMLLSLCLCLAGCGSSPPTQFITLAPGFAAKDHALQAADTQEVFQVGKITLPSQLDRLALVRRLDPNRLDVQVQIQWAGPLDVLVRQALSANLARLLPKGAVVPPGSSLPDGVHGSIIPVNIQQFSAGPDSQVALKAYWSIVDSATKKTEKRGTAHILVPVKSQGGGAVAAAMSKALDQLAHEILAGK